MKRTMTTVAGATLLLGAFLLVVPRTQGGESPAPSVQPIRIAYVDLDRMAESQMVKERVKAVEKELMDKRESYKIKAEELRRLAEELRQQQAVLTPEQIAQKKQQVRVLQDELDRLNYEAERTVNKTSAEIIEPVLDEVLAAVESVARTYQIDLVLRGDFVLFGSERVDLTDTVIRELDRKASAKQPPLSPASTPARRSAKPEAGKDSATSPGSSGATKKAPKPQN